MAALAANLNFVAHMINDAVSGTDISGAYIPRLQSIGTNVQPTGSVIFMTENATDPAISGVSLVTQAAYADAVITAARSLNAPCIDVFRLHGHLRRDYRERHAAGDGFLNALGETQIAGYSQTAVQPGFISI